MKYHISWNIPYSITVNYAKYNAYLILDIVKPILIGLIVIISGLVLAKAQPRARIIVGYSFVVLLLTIMIIISLIFVTCDKAPIIGIDKNP